MIVQVLTSVLYTHDPVAHIEQVMHRAARSGGAASVRRGASRPTRARRKDRA